MIRFLKKKLVPITLIAFIVGLSFRFFVGDGSLVHVYLLNKEIAGLKILADKQHQRNVQLERVISSLKNDYDVVETIARRDMKMIGKDEIFFVEE